jgi:hypothetical protein
MFSPSFSITCFTFICDPFTDSLSSIEMSSRQVCLYQKIETRYGVYLTSPIGTVAVIVSLDVLMNLEVLTPLSVDHKAVYSCC